MKRKNDTKKKKDLEEILDKIFVESLLSLWVFIRLALKAVMVGTLLVLLSPIIMLSQIFTGFKDGDDEDD